METKMIWDSGFGYDICILVSEEEISCKILLATGKYAGKTITALKEDVKPYSEELMSELSKKYKYNQSIQLQN